MQSEEERSGGLGSSDNTSLNYRSIDRLELEELAITAIRLHRSLLAADQEVYDEWTRASDNPSIPRSVVEALQAEYLARQRKSEAQQTELSDILDALGYVPSIPGDEDEVSSK